MTIRYQNGYSYCKHCGEYRTEDQIKRSKIGTPLCKECSLPVRTKKRHFKKETKDVDKLRIDLSKGISYIEYDGRCMCSFCKINCNLWWNLKRWSNNKTRLQARKDFIFKSKECVQIIQSQDARPRK